MKNFISFLILFQINILDAIAVNLKSRLSAYSKSKLFSKARKQEATIDFQDNTADDWYMITDMKISASSHEPGFGAVKANGIAEWRSKDGTDTYLEILFPDVTRVHHLYWVWTFPPSNFYTMVTLDGIDFIKVSQAFITLLDSENDPNGIKKEQLLYFAHPVWCLAIRIFMLKPLLKIFGLEKVTVFSANAPMIMKTLGPDKKWYCLTNEMGYEFTGMKYLFAEECDKASIASDGRELFNFKKLYMFKSFIDRQCFTLVEGKDVDYTHIEFIDCKLLDGIKDRRDIWKMVPTITKEEYLIVNRRPLKTWFKSMKNPDKCVTMLKYPVQLNHIINATAEASCETIDGKHEAKLIVDNEPDTYWASNPGVEEVKVSVNFMPVTIKTLTIKFKEAPSVFMVNAKTLNGQYKRVASFYSFDTTKTSVDIKLYFALISGFEIVFEKFGDPKKPKEDSFYALYELRIKSGYHPVVLMGCNSKDDSKEWILEEYYFENSLKGIKLQKNKEMYAKAQFELFKNLKTLSEIGPELSRMKYSQDSFESRLPGGRIIFGERRRDAKEVDNDVKAKFPLERPPKKNISLGYTADAPARDCYEVQEIYKIKRDGFYWIKNECVQQPLRVFCSFVESQPRTLFYMGGIKSNEASKLLKSVIELRSECAKKGLRPIHITSTVTIDTVVSYLKILNLKIEKEQAIPLAFDYNCNIQNCKGQYSSLTEEETPLNQFWTSDMDFSRPYLGFAFRDFALHTFDLKNSSLLYKGIICSTNSDKKYFSDDNFVVAECETTMLDSKFDVSLFTKVNVKCPGKCHLSEEYKAYGTSIYAEESNICVAAVHAGRIDPYTGGYIILGIEQGLNKYEGTLANKVNSLSLPKSGRSFVIIPFDFGCPVVIADEEEFIQMKQLLVKRKILRNRFALAKTGNSFLELSSTSESQLAKGNDNFYELGNDITILETVTRALTKVNKKVLAEVTVIDNPSFKNELFEEDLSVELYSKTLKSIGEFINYNNEAIEKKMKILRESTSSQAVEPITLSSKFENNFYIYDFANSFNKVEWQIVQNAMKPTFKVEFTQKEEESPDLASIAELKDKAYYDFAFVSTVEVSEGVGFFGLLFRFIDQFNYYSYETSYGEFITTRIVRVERNKRIIVYEMKQNGIQISIPYIVNITMSGDDIIVKAGPVTEGQAPIVEVKTRDEAFNYGGVAFLTTSSRFSVSDITLYRLNCKEIGVKVLSEDETLPQVKCSRFRESFISTIEASWDVYDPENCTECPSAWSFQRTETKIILNQQSVARPTLPFVIPSLLKLKKPEACNNGYIILDFVPYLKEGYVGVAFDIVSPFEFSVFEVGGKNCSITSFKEGGVVTSKIVKDCKFSPGFIYSIIIQLSIDPEVKDFAYLIDYGKPGKSRKVEILDRPTEFKSGSLPSDVGISTRGTRVNVEKFELIPSEDIEALDMGGFEEDLAKIKEAK